MRWLLVVLLLLAIGLQFVPVDRSNPPVVADFDGPNEVADRLRHACYDCHSRETRWPWYARVAPVSWLVSHHVKEGRQALDLSAWGEFGAVSRAAVAAEMVEEIQDGTMPPGLYLCLHPEARLGEADRVALGAWAASLRPSSVP
ncbi:MAG: heme-binding domain-containing protein [Deltaproteobacteria bacterium]|nr:heme-binding domain-containing protein [Deltaproteobacteria bacterium]